MLMRDQPHCTLGAWRRWLLWKVLTRRTATLSGVPVSTVHERAPKNAVAPNVPTTRIKLSSYADLMAFRIISCLRHEKEVDGSRIRASAMTEVRRALRALKRSGIDLGGGPRDVAVSRRSFGSDLHR